MADVSRSTGNGSTVIRSGIAPLDRHSGGGLEAGRIHLVTGGVGTGKSIAALQFLGAGLERGESAMLLTSSRPADVRAQAAYAGVPIEAALREGRLVALRFRPAFTSRMAHSASPRTALDDLRRMLGAMIPTRIAIDPVSPFLSDGSALGEGLTALAKFLDELGATALLTCPGDISQGTDRRFDGLTERAATLIHLARAGGGLFDLAIVRGRGPGQAGGSLRFAIAPRTGIVAVPDGPPPERERGLLEPRVDSPVPPSRSLRLLQTSDAIAPEIVEILQRDYQLSVSPLAAVNPGSAREHVGALVIEAHHGSLDATRAFVQRSAATGGRAPIIVIARFNLRSIDRARLFRAGVDEVLATDMSPPELLQRLSAAVARGHLDQPLIRYSERTLIHADVNDGRAGPLDRTTFARALAEHVAHDHPTQYTVVSLAPGRPLRGTHDAAAPLAQLTEVVMRTARVASGDFVACFDGRVAVYLHGARRGDASPFVERVRGAWPTRERGSIEIDFFSYPSDEPRLRTLMEASLQS